MIYQAKQINEKYNSIGQMQILYSEPGCEKQASHIDEEPGGPQFISSIFTLDDDTIIYLNDKRVVLSSCNLISIHSTTTHNGGENQSLCQGNYRVHAYIGPKNTTFVPHNAVGVPLQCRYAKFGCCLTFGSAGKKYYHHQRCGFNPNNTIQKMREAKKRRSIYNKRYYKKSSSSANSRL
jgi:hypothetical protein